MASGLARSPRCPLTPCRRPSAPGSLVRRLRISPNTAARHLSLAAVLRALGPNPKRVARHLMVSSRSHRGVIKQQYRRPMPPPDPGASPRCWSMTEQADPPRRQRRCERRVGRREWTNLVASLLFHAFLSFYGVEKTCRRKYQPRRWRSAWGHAAAVVGGVDELHVRVASSTSMEAVPCWRWSRKAFSW